MVQKEILIESFTKRGDGAGSILLEGSQVPSRVEIPHTLPQDRVIADLRKKRKRVVKGRLLEIVSPSPFRIRPPCEHAEICGGCSWQSLEYSRQLEVKEKILQDIFYEFAAFVKISPIIACDNPFCYRNKMEFSFSQNRGGMRYLGLMIARADRYVFNIRLCHLVSPWFSDVLNATRSWWEESKIAAYRPMENRGALRTLTIREGKNTQQKMVVLTVSHHPEDQLTEEDVAAFVCRVMDALKGEKVSIFLRIQRAEKGRETTFEERLLHGDACIQEKLFLDAQELSFKISPSSFFQPNTLQAQKLFLQALAMVKPKPSDLLFDLYCGSGAIGMVFAPFVRKVVGIEENAYAVADGRENLLLNEIGNYQLLEGDVGKVLRAFVEKKDFEAPDIVVVDPPRGGLDSLAIAQIRLLHPKILLYISCNPATQMENIKYLQKDYRLLQMQPIDQFPHTPHIENIALLERI